MQYNLIEVIVKFMDSSGNPFIIKRALDSYMLKHLLYEEGFLKSVLLDIMNAKNYHLIRTDNLTTPTEERG
jgi:hypothetical protein